MDEIQIKKTFEAIKHDNVKLFSSIMLSKSDLNLCYGRFPLLSLCYLYGSYKILDKYEKNMLSIFNFKIVEEYAEIYLKFKKLAGKSIRFFVQENKMIVYPIFVLALKGDNQTIAKYYDKIYKDVEIIDILQKIYNFKHENNIEISSSKFICKRNKIEKNHKFIIFAVSVIMCLMSIFPLGTILSIKNNSGIGIENSPIKISTEKELKTALSDGNRYYKLSKDIALTDNFVVDKFSGKIDGDGHTLKLAPNQQNYLINNLSGEIKNLVFETSSSELKIKNNFSVIANKLLGKLENCEIFGDFNLTYEISDDTYFSLFAVENEGTILKCVASSNINAKNSTNKNAFLTLFASKNSGVIENCETSKTIIKTDTIDVAGIVCENNGEIIGCENRAEIYQQSKELWHPNSAGIALNNYGSIKNVTNFGNVTSISLNEQNVSADNKDGFAVYSAGIACINTNLIESSMNFGNIVASAKTATVYAGGLVSMNGISDSSAGKILNSKATCDIKVENQDEEKYIYVGGLVGSSDFSIDGCGYEGNIEIVSNGYCSAGGITGVNYFYAFNNEGNIVSNCYSAVVFIKENVDDKTYKGALVGLYRNSTPVLYLNNNHYVKNGSFEFAMYFQQIVNNMAFSPQEVQDNQCASTAYDTIEELKENASGVNI